jgi:Tfp pilus assembly protein PilX
MRSFRPAARAAQRGVILFVALIILVAMSLAGIALMRSVDTNVLIAGNLAFRQGAMMAGDWGVESARTWLDTNKAGTTLNNDQPAVTSGTGYWANWQAAQDLYGRTASTVDDYNWNNAITVGTDSGGNEVRYVIHRLCSTAGDISSGSVSCVKGTSGGGATPASTGTKGTVSYGGAALPGVSMTYYRVTVRVTGPRSTVSYVQAILN